MAGCNSLKTQDDDKPLNEGDCGCFLMNCLDIVTWYVSLKTAVDEMHFSKFFVVVLFLLCVFEPLSIDTISMVLQSRVVFLLRVPCNSPQKHDFSR